MQWYLSEVWKKLRLSASYGASCPLDFVDFVDRTRLLSKAKTLLQHLLVQFFKKHALTWLNRAIIRRSLDMSVTFRQFYITRSDHPRIVALQNILPPMSYHNIDALFFTQASIRETLFGNNPINCRTLASVLVILLWFSLLFFSFSVSPSYCLTLLDTNHQQSVIIL